MSTDEKANEASQDTKAAPISDAWGSRLGVILAVAGSAVGLGNFLRFPGQAAQNGGGAFMVPYFLALIFVGIPVAWIEWTIARYGGRKGFHSAPGIFGVVAGNRWGRYAGVLGLVIPVVIVMYYVLIESWCLRYFIAYLTGGMDLGTDAAQFGARSSNVFDQVTASAANGFTSPDGGLSMSIVFWVIAFAINILFIYRGLSGGIEKFCSLAMPIMAVSALVVLVRVLTLGTPNPDFPDQNVVGGLGAMWNPDWSKLARFDTWLAAAGQIFFSLSVGFGVVLNYASYLRKKDDVVLSGLTSVATNEVFEVGFGGLITIPASFIFLGASAAAGGTFDLGFKTLPVVFEYMGPLGKFIGGVWFFMLFLAAITSSLSMLQPAIAFLSEALAISRRRAVFYVSLLVLFGSAWVIYFSEGLVALDTMDFWVGTLLIFVMAMAQVMIFLFGFGVKRGFDEAHLGADMRIPNAYRFIIKFVTPAFLLVIFVGFCFQGLGDRLDGLAQNVVARNTTFVVLAVLALLVVVTRMGEKRWRVEGRDLDGVNPPED